MSIFTLDTAYLCISRFILLDSMLLFFTFTTVFFMVKFHNQRHEYVYYFVILINSRLFEVI